MEINCYLCNGNDIESDNKKLGKVYEEDIFLRGDGAGRHDDALVF
jgi:hypothetical protein